MKRFLIIKPSSMGDVLHAFPAVHALLQKEPDAQIDWVICPAFAELLDYLPGIQRRILFQRKEMGKLKTFFPTFFRFQKELRKESYDIVIDLQGLIRSALIGLLARSWKKYGPSSAKEWLAPLCYTHRMKVMPEIKHALQKNCVMLADILQGEEISTEYRLPVVQKYAESARNLLKNSGFEPDREYIAIAPGARWKTKEWPPEFFAEAASLILKQYPEMHFVLLGSPAENTLCERITQFLPPESSINLSGKTSMGELVELVRGARVLLCNDSGPMHIAAAVGTPLVAIFAPTDPELTGPFGKNCHVLQPELDCLRCMQKHCKTMHCHTALSSRTFSEEAMKLLAIKEKHL